MKEKLYRIQELDLRIKVLYFCLILGLFILLFCRVFDAINEQEQANIPANGNTIAETVDDGEEQGEEKDNPSKYQDPIPIYVGEFNGPYDISDKNTRVTEVLDGTSAEQLIRRYLPETIGVSLVSTSRSDSTGLTCYHFLQSYGPLLIENAAIDVYVDDWGNWKRLEGRYAILTGSIAEIDERAYKGAEYRILLCADQKAKTVIVAGDGKYLARDGKTELKGI